MPHKDLPGTQDETWTGGLCLITMDPESHCIFLAQLAQARAQVSWKAWLAPTLAQLHGRVIQATSDEAPGLLADVEHDLEAHHSPALFPVQPEWVKAVSGPRATKERAAQQAVTEATTQLERLHSDTKSASAEPEKRCPGRPPKDPMSMEHAEQALAAARRAHACLAGQRAPVQARIRGIGHDDHCGDLERGVRRNARLMASDLQGHIDEGRPVAQQDGLIQSCVERIEKAERVVPKRQATIAFVSGYGAQPGAQLDLTPPVAFVMHAKLAAAAMASRGDSAPSRCAPRGLNPVASSAR